MIAVDVQYRPLGFLPAARKSFFLPVRWSELSEQQLENVSLVLNPDVNEDILISLILRMSRLFARRLDSYQKFSILRQLKYLRQSDTCDMFIITRLSGLHAPERYLRNVTFGQLSSAIPTGSVISTGGRRTSIISWHASTLQGSFPTATLRRMQR